MAKLLKANRDDDGKKPSSAQIVASNDDLLPEIIHCLPFKKIVQLRLVSKYWNSILFDPKLCLLRNRPAVGLIFECLTAGLETTWHTISLDKSISPTIGNMTAIIEDPLYRDHNILHSCNGLLVWVSRPTLNITVPKCYICNPTTRNYIEIPVPERVPNRSIRGMYLAFDPSMSPNYRVVCVMKSVVDWSFWFEVYSSETSSWNKGGELFEENKNFHCTDGVYWNGAIHWVKLVTGPREFVYLNPFCDRTVKVFPSPPLKNESYDRNDYYFGESCDHLHFVDAYNTLDNFIVYEMKRDYSEWFVKYEVHVPEMNMYYSHWFVWPDVYEVFVRCSSMTYTVVRGKNDQDSFLVIANKRMIVRYNIEQKTCEALWDSGSTCTDHSKLLFCSRCPFQYVESICSI